MLTVIIRNDGEDRVVELTYQNLWKELKDIPKAQLLIRDHWFMGNMWDDIENSLVCLVEADCLVNSGYFSSQLGLFKKNKYLRKLAMLSSSTAVKNWSNKFYGYTLDSVWSKPVDIDGDTIQTKNRFIRPVTISKSRSVYPVQIGYVPGAIIRTTMLGKALLSLQPNDGFEKNLVKMSTELSFAFWQQGDGNRVHINPNATYVTTEDYVNDIGDFTFSANNLPAMFTKESI